MNLDKLLFRSVLSLQEKLDSAYWNKKISHPRNHIFLLKALSICLFSRAIVKENLVLGSKESYNISILLCFSYSEYLQ